MLYARREATFNGHGFWYPGNFGILRRIMRGAHVLEAGPSWVTIPAGSPSIIFSRRDPRPESKEWAAERERDRALYQFLPKSKGGEIRDKRLSLYSFWSRFFLSLWFMNWPEHRHIRPLMSVIIDSGHL